MNNNEFPMIIKRIENELYDLKIASDLSPNIKTYTTSIPVENWLPFEDLEHVGAVVDIEYDDGDNDILAVFNFNGSVTAEEPRGNKQRLLVYNQISEGTLMVVSTRPIKSITNPSSW